MLTKVFRGLLLGAALVPAVCPAQDFFQRGPVEALVYRSGKDRAYLTLTRRDGISPAERITVGEVLTFHRDEASTEGLTLKLHGDAAELIAAAEKWTPLAGTYQRLAEPERLASARDRAVKADAELNRIYGEVRGKLTTARKDDLRDLQREWIRFAYEAGNGAKGAPDETTAEYWQTRGDRAAERVYFLKEYAKNSPEANAQELRSQLAAAQEDRAWPAVAEIARRILGGAPKDSEIWEARARAFAYQQDWDRCTGILDDWEKAVTPKPVVIEALRGDVAWGEDDAEEAIRRWTNYVKAAPKELEIRERLAHALELAGDWRNAVVWREQRVRNRPDSAALCRLAIAQAVLRDWKKMGATVRRASQEVPIPDEVKRLLPRVERMEKALPELKSLDAAAATGANPLLERALFFSNLGWPEIALTDVDAALQRDAESRRARLQKAAILRALDRSPLAEKLPGVEVGKVSSITDYGFRKVGEADAALLRGPGNAVWLAARGRALINALQTQLALEDADAALKLEPKNDIALSVRGQALAQTNKEWDALPLLTQAVELNPKNTPAWYWLGVIESKHRNFEPAVKALSQVLDDLPNDLDALNLREKNLRALGRNVEADLDAGRTKMIRERAEAALKQKL